MHMNWKIHVYSIFKLTVIVISVVHHIRFCGEVNCFMATVIVLAYCKERDKIMLCNEEYDILMFSISI